MRWSRWRQPPDVVWIVALALVVRVLFLLETRGDPLFSILAIDAHSYHELASRFAGGDWLFGEHPLWFPVLYPVLLGCQFLLWGDGTLAPRLLQAGVGCATAAIGALLARRLHSRAAGWTAGLLLALLPVPVFYETQLLYTSWALLLTAWTLFALVGCLRKPARGRPLLAGLALGAIGLLRTNALVFLPVGLLLLWRARGRRAATLYLIGALLLSLPVLLRNGVVAGTWTPLTVNGGMIFATAYAEDAKGGRALRRSPRDFGPHGAFHREAERLVGRELTLAEASDVHRERALRRIRENPGWTARLTLAKLGLLLNAREIDDNLGFALGRGRSRVLSLVPAPWAWVLVPAAVGAWFVVRRRRPPGARPDARPGSSAATAIVLYGLMYAGTLLVFFVNSRYRLPLLVPGAVLAGVAVAEVAKRARAGRRRELIVPVALAVAVSLAAFRDPGVRASPALELLAVGAALEEAGEHEDSLAMTDAALRLDPQVAGAHQNRALALLALGRTEAALAAATEATRLDPDLAPAWLTRGAILARSGRIAAAEPAFATAARLAPENAAAHANLARARHALGDLPGAIAAGETAVRLGQAALAPLVATWREEVRRE